MNGHTGWPDRATHPLDGAMVIWGSHYRPSEFRACLDGDAVTGNGTLRDGVGPVVTFGDRLEIHAGYRIELGDLPPDVDLSWQRDAS